MTEWFELEEIQPNDGDNVFVCDEFNPGIYIAKYHEEGFNFTLIHFDAFELPNEFIVTHWSPFPVHPEFPFMYIP